MRISPVAARLVLGLSLTTFVGCQKNLPTPASDPTATAASADASGATVTVTCPSSFVVGQSATFSGTTSAGTYKVIVSVDGFVIKDMPVTNGAYSFSYAFSQAGASRSLNVNAFSSAGVSLAQVAKTIGVTSTAVPYVQNMPYFYQLNNTNGPRISCQNTSLAMCLKYYGINVTPDQLSSYYGVGADAAGGPQTIANNFNSEAIHAGKSIRDYVNVTGTRAQLRQLAGSGKPVIVQGYFTNGGHVVVVIGFDGTYYYVNDPYGTWNQQQAPNAAYTNTPTGGIAVRYTKAALETAIGVDGDMWFHDFR